MEADLLIGNGRASTAPLVVATRSRRVILGFLSRLQRFGWRKRFVIDHVEDSSSVASLLENERELDVIYMYAHAWIERYGVGNARSFQDDLYAIGLKRRAARSIAAALEPLHGTCYSHKQMLEIAVECVLGKYAGIGRPRLMFYATEAIVDEWCDHVALKRVYNSSDAVSQDLSALAHAIDAVADVSHDPSTTKLFYHATNWASAVNIATHGVDRTRGRRCLDFGIQPGFYLTPDIQIGFHWCQTNVERWDGESCIMVFSVSSSHGFPNAKTFDAANKEWKQLVSHSRHCQGATNALDWCDVVYGPMAANIKAIVEKNAVAKTHTVPKFQMASKSNASDLHLSNSYVGTLFFAKRRR